MLNAWFSASYFWDGRARTLEEQAKQLLLNTAEMGMENEDALVRRLSSIDEYRWRFRRVFPRRGITLDNVARAIAALERTLVSDNSPFDRFIRDDRRATTAAQKNGWELFKDHTTTFDYDDKQNLIRATDPLSNAVTFTYNAAGQPLSAKDALNNTTQLTYHNGDLVGVTDPRGHTGSAFIDAAGRLLSSRTPLGQASRYEYDALDRPVKATDALGGITEFTYDANSNLLSVEDARNNVTSYTYDNMNRLTSRTDSLQHVETYEYDAMGNLRKFTDRRGKVTSYVYDNLYRLTFVGFGTTGEPANPSYESTITYSYDTAGRLNQVTDSASGPITYAFDDLNRLTSKTTSQGTINYSYDAAGRRTSMTVAGQPVVNYSYDSANRLIQIAQGTTTVSFVYDSANRLTSISQSNGIIVEYGYDEVSNVTSIVYKKEAAVLGNLTYEYDAVGKRTRMGGSFARTGLPQALTSTTYGAANRLTQRAGANFTYDENGNLTSDGTNTYSWNARNQLASMSGPELTASFQYDASGRRVNKTVNGVSTSYLYDGANAVQELSGANPTANMLNGGLDKVLTRTDGSDARTPLTDGRGSTLALADDIGTLQTQYTYDAFGNTTTTGATSTNPSKYTGRDDDGTGLYYYRARYYSPSLQRFISEDPAGFGGGDVNLYSYVGNDPVNFVDPSGLCGVFSLQTGPNQKAPCQMEGFDAANGFTSGIGRFSAEELNDAAITVLGETQSQIARTIYNESIALASEIMNRSDDILLGIQGNNPFGNSPNLTDVVSAGGGVQFAGFRTGQQIIQSGKEFYQGERNCVRFLIAAQAVALSAVNPFRPNYRFNRSNFGGRRKRRPWEVRIGGNDFSAVPM